MAYLFLYGARACAKIDDGHACDLQRTQLVALSGCPLRLPERFLPEEGAVVGGMEGSS